MSETLQKAKLPTLKEKIEAEGESERKKVEKPLKGALKAKKTTTNGKKKKGSRRR